MKKTQERKKKLKICVYYDSLFRRCHAATVTHPGLQVFASHAWSQCTQETLLLEHSLMTSRSNSPSSYQRWSIAPAEINPKAVEVTTWEYLSAVMVDNRSSGCKHNWHRE